MTIFYRGPCARITHEVFELRVPCRHTFAIRELYGACAIRGRTRALLIHSARIKVCSQGLAGPALVVTTLGGPVLDRPSVSITAMVVLIASMLTWLGCRATQMRPYQLWAWYRGDWVCLYEEFDRLAFRQVSRGLMRALEHLEETS